MVLDEESLARDFERLHGAEGGKQVELSRAGKASSHSKHGKESPRSSSKGKSSSKRGKSKGQTSSKRTGKSSKSSTRGASKSTSKSKDKGKGKGKGKGDKETDGASKAGGSLAEPESERERRLSTAEESSDAPRAAVEARTEPRTKAASGKGSGKGVLSRGFGKRARRKAKDGVESAEAAAPAEPPGQPPSQPHSVQEQEVLGEPALAQAAEQAQEPLPAGSAAEEQEAPPSAAVPERKRSAKSGSGGTRRRAGGSSSGRKAHSRSGSASRKSRKQALSDDVTPVDFCGDFFVPLEQSTREFECLSEGDIIAQQAVHIENVTEVLSVPASTAIALLKHFKWSKDRLLTAYFDAPEKTLQQAGVVRDETKGPGGTAALQAGAGPSSDLGECTICGDELDDENTFKLPACGHEFCVDCWGQYLSIKIHEGQTAQLACMHQACAALVPEEAIQQLVPEETYRKFCTFLMQSFVNDSEHVKWCPAPNCGRAVTATMVQGQTVRCLCGHSFCFRCSEEAHLPASCEELKEWSKKCQDESETKHWIVANTRDCPKCQLPTEKNGGCNHMTCVQCSHEYCWICMKDWKGHNDYYTCNRFVKSKEEKTKASKKGGKKERERQREDMRRALEKYLHYSSRFLNHERSKEFDRLQEMALRKMHTLQETEATGAEVLFIEQATRQLRECRAVLKYSYVCRYYMVESDPREELFGYLQESLEITVEKLAAALQKPKNRRVEIIDLTALAKSRYLNLLHAVER